MQPTAPPPASDPAIPVPKISSLALYAIAAIGVIAIGGVFGYILFASGLSFTSQLWWMGVCGLIFSLLFYMVYASTHNRTITFPLAGAFFVIGVGSFYGSILVDENQGGLGKLVLSVILSIFVVIILGTIYYMSRQSERDAVRKSQRKVTP
jgi:uncharacterized membrane protein